MENNGPHTVRNWAVLLVLQVLCGVLFGFSPYISISVLPLLIMSLPLKVGTTPALLLSFGAGLFVDLLSSAPLGMTSVALLPVALLRRPVLGLFLSDLTSMDDEGSPLSRTAPYRSLLILLTAVAIHVTVYVIIDSAGMRQGWLNLVKILISVVTDTLVCQLLSMLFFSDRSAR